MGLLTDRHGDFDIVKTIIVSVIVIVCLLIGFAIKPWTLVDEGNAVIFKRMGKAVSAKGPGFHTLMPILTTTDEMNIREQKIQIDATASTKDLQQITIKYAVNFRLPLDSALETYKNQGMNYQIKVIEPNIEESSKSVIAMYTAEEMITKRQEVSNGIVENYKKRIQPYGLKIISVNIIDFVFSAKYVDSIEQKQIAQQEALKAENELARIKIEAEQKITQAKAEAESLRLQKENVTPMLVELRKIEVLGKAIDKWNGYTPGVLSIVSGCNGKSPLILDVGDQTSVLGPQKNN